MNPETDIRTHVILPKDILAKIDLRVGQRRRSKFLADAARRELEHLELIEIARAAAGSGKGQPRPWGDTSESIAQWVHDDRQASGDRDDELDSLRARVAENRP
ncbi:MAG: hypothetical protein IT419_16915 [Planctomycetes bacterium]|nr:hypothetical protein [Planctomycetota bacterium]